MGRSSPPPSSVRCHVETLVLPALLHQGPVVISPRETGLPTGRHQEARTRLELLALGPRPWSSVEALAVASLPSSSSVTYTIGCYVISRPYIALQAISHWFKRLILRKKKKKKKKKSTLVDTTA